MFKKSVLAAIAIVALGAETGFAGTATIAINGGNLQVNAQVNASCAASQGSAVSFPAIQSMASPITTTGTITVTCDNGVPYAVGLDSGSNASGAQRRMSNFSFVTGITNYLPYEVYVDAANTTPFTNIATGASGSTTGSPTASTPGGTGTGLAQTLTVYGTIPAGTKPPPGNYNDTLAITVGY